MADIVDCYLLISLEINVVTTLIWDIFRDVYVNLEWFLDVTQTMPFQEVKSSQLIAAAR